MPRWRSVRVRTTVAATILVATTLTIASALLLVTVERSLTTSRDEVARALARQLVQDVEGGRVATPITVGEDAMAQVVAADGTVLAASANLGDASAVTEQVPDPGQFVVLLLGQVPDDQDTETFRVWALGTQSADGPVGVYVGSSPERTDEAVRALRRSLLVGVPAVLAMFASATWVLVGRALRPVETIRAEVTEMSVAHPERRVQVPATGDEVERLAETMNAMLQRLDDGHRRQREFVADASHELLSPLAAFRTRLEVAADDPEATVDRDLLEALLADSDRMERLVRDLLYLAREDAGPPPDTGPLPLLDLDSVVLDEARRLRARPGVVVDTSQVSAAPVRGRPEELSRMVRNLMENAAAHAATSVRLQLGLLEGRVELTVIDDGPGIPEDLRHRVFQRFVRAQPDRALSNPDRSTGGGTGLGLPIALAIARRHGGDLELLDAATGTRMRVTLPVAPAPDPEPTPDAA